MEDAILKLIDEARRQGQAAGMRMAIGIIEVFLAKLNDPYWSADLPNVADRKDQLERVLNTLNERK